MPPSNLSQADLDAIGRIVDQRIDRRMGVVEKRVDKHSGEYREIVPELKRGLRESQHEIEDRNMGFEKMMMGVVGRIEEKVDTALNTIPPAAKGAELAAVAGEKASVRAANRTEAVQVAADRADTQSKAAKVASNRNLIVQIVFAVGVGVWELIKFIMANSGSAGH